MSEFPIVLIAVGLALLVLSPLFFIKRDTREPAARRGAATPLDERRSQLIHALQELEEEHQQGRMGDDDYRELKAQLEVEAAAVLKELDAVGRVGGGGGRGGQAETVRPAWAKAIGWSVAIVAFVVLAGFVLNAAVKPRTDEGPMTGGPAAGAPGAAAGPMMGQLMALMARSSGHADTTELPALAARLAKDSSDVAALVQAGHLYLVEQDLGPAAHVSMKALELDHKNVEAHTHIAMILFAQGRSDVALQVLDQVLLLKPDFPEALLYKGMMQLASGGDPSEAWERFFKVAPPDADTTRVATMLAAVKARQGG